MILEKDTAPTIAIIPNIMNWEYSIKSKPWSCTSFVVSGMNIVVSCVWKVSSRKESLYLNVISISFSPYVGSPSNSIGMLNGTGESISTSSMYWVDFLMLESPSGSRVTKPNRASSFPSLII